jgi:hypothetical protein
VSELTRLGFIKSSAATVAGLTVLGGVAAEADAKPVPVGSKPVVAYLKDPGTGEITVMSGDREVTVSDRKLAAQIARAAR